MPACSVPVRASHPDSRKRLTASLRTKRNPERRPVCSVPVRASHPDSRKRLTASLRTERNSERMPVCSVPVRASHPVRPVKPGRIKPGNTALRIHHSSFIIPHSSFLSPIPPSLVITRLACRAVARQGEDRTG